MFARGGTTAIRNGLVGVALCIGVLAASASSAGATTNWPTWGSNWNVRAEPNSAAISVGKINAGAVTKQQVTVECQTRGEPVDLGSAGKSAMWARLTAPIRGYLTVVAVAIPQDELPGVPPCGATAPRPPTGPTCAHGEYQKRYLGYKRSYRLSHSIARLTWQPKLCRDATGPYRVVDGPQLRVIGPGSLLGLGLELRAPQGTTRDVLYRGDVRKCTPFSIGYGILGFSGESCRTVGRVDIRATPDARGGIAIVYRASTVKSASRKYGTWVWTQRVI